jgi:predicted MFS family arabinose efflux permease
MAILPRLLLSPVIGVIVDRGHPASLAYRAEFFRLAVLVVYGLLYRGGLATEVLGYCVSFCMALGSEVQLLSWRAALARSVGREDLFRLNALTVVGGQTGQILGAAASGMLLAAIGASATIALTGATFFVSGILGFLVARHLAPGEQVSATPHPRGRYLDDLRDGIRHIVERPQIAFFHSLIIANMTVIYGMNAMLAPFVREELRFGAAAFGQIDAAYALGAIVSGAFIVRLSNRFGRRAILLSGLAVAAVSLFTFSQGQSFVLACAVYVCLGASFQTSVISLSAAQEATETAFQGRVSATFNTLNGLVGLAVYIIVAVFAGHHLYREFYVAQAAGMLILIPIVLSASRRQRLAALLNPG